MKAPLGPNGLFNGFCKFSDIMGNVSSVIIKTSAGELKRPISKLRVSVLPETESRCF